ncbi:hypothetical protein CYMTET_45837 [Cymbomonas tetramitiformis]|uniref:Uncharacterized protein n=1 Tax=Cymbomonas tetramitiformis TaxID=36881 RepID=A0AAE0EXX2_9CHLO|nr:hypothetical protein CYMTET_45837 [Cymbomonas tetramitiformis]
MAPEEHKEDHPLRSARPADHLEKNKVTLMTSLLASVVRTFKQIIAVLQYEGRLDSKKSSNVLAAIREIKTTVRLVVDIEDIHGECHDEDHDLPYLSDGSDSDSEDDFLDQESYEIAEHHKRSKLGESEPLNKITFCDDKLTSLAGHLPTCMRACLSNFGVVSFADGRRDDVAGTISAEGYEELKKVTGQSLGEEQRQRMNQVQPVCKLRDDSMEHGMALVSAGGDLILSHAILMDSGANCNIISPRVVKMLGLKVLPMEVGDSHVARCDGTNAQFREYAYVDAIDRCSGDPSRHARVRHGDGLQLGPALRDRPHGELAQVVAESVQVSGHLLRGSWGERKLRTRRHFATRQTQSA